MKTANIIKNFLKRDIYSHSAKPTILNPTSLPTVNIPRMDQTSNNKRWEYGKPLTVWHGTTSDAIPSIREKGLVPGRVTYYNIPVSEGDKVYTTPRKKVAATFAVAGIHKGNPHIKPALLRINLSAEDVKKNVSLEDIRRSETGTPWEVVTAPIPPDKIVVVGPKDTYKTLQKLKIHTPSSELGDFPGTDIVSDERKLSESPYVTLWHGTTKKNAEQILKEGLLQKNINAFGTPLPISLTPSKSAAILHAVTGPEMDNESKGRPRLALGVPLEEHDIANAAILKVTIPKDMTKFGMIQPIELYTGKRLKQDYEVNIRGRIPPEHIKKVDIRKFRQRAYAESKTPEQVGKTYDTEVWQNPEDRITAYHTDTALSTFPNIDQYSGNKMIPIYRGVSNKEAEKISKTGKLIVEPRYIWDGSQGLHFTRNLNVARGYGSGGKVVVAKTNIENEDIDQEYIKQRYPKGVKNPHAYEEHEGKIQTVEWTNPAIELHDEHIVIRPMSQFKSVEHVWDPHTQTLYDPKVVAIQEPYSTRKKDILKRKYSSEYEEGMSDTQRMNKWMREIELGAKPEDRKHLEEMRITENLPLIDKPWGDNISNSMANIIRLDKLRNYPSYYPKLMLYVPNKVGE